MNVSKKKLKMNLVILLLAFTALLWGNSLSIYAKANLAKFLISNAWESTLNDGKNHKPWRWADTWPVGKLYFPRQRKTLYILSGSFGASLAFGPGHMDGTALPSEQGTTVIGGHRDTHFRFLQDLVVGDIFLIQGKDGQWQYYRLDETQIADIRHGPWYVDENKKEIHLITCFPFESMLPGGPLRFVAVASPVFKENSINEKSDGKPNLASSPSYSF